MFIQFLDACDDVTLKNILSIIKRILLLVQIFAPILLIVMASIAFFNSMRNPDDKKETKKIFNKFIAAAMIFFIPVLLDAVMGMIGENNKFSSCWVKANDKVDYSTGFQEITSQEINSIIPNPEDYEPGEKRPTTSSTGGGNRGSKIIPSEHQEKGAQAFAAAAREELAAWESGEADWRRYKYPFTGPDNTNTGGWCGMFIGYIGGKVGSGAVHWQGDALPAEPTTPRNYHDWYSKNPQAGEIIENGPGVKPKVGDLVLMWSGAHVEMVEDVRSDGFWCIGGGGSVDHNWHSFESGNDTWFIRPNWSQVQDTSNWESLIRSWGATVEAPER